MESFWKSQLRLTSFNATVGMAARHLHSYLCTLGYPGGWWDTSSGTASPPPGLILVNESYFELRVRFSRLDGSHFHESTTAQQGQFVTVYISWEVANQGGRHVADFEGQVKLLQERLFNPGYSVAFALHTESSQVHYLFREQTCSKLETVSVFDPEGKQTCGFEYRGNDMCFTETPREEVEKVLASLDKLWSAIGESRPMTAADVQGWALPATPADGGEPVAAPDAAMPPTWPPPWPAQTPPGVQLDFTERVELAGGAAIPANWTLPTPTAVDQLRVDAAAPTPYPVLEEHRQRLMMNYPGGFHAATDDGVAVLVDQAMRAQEEASGHFVNARRDEIVRMMYNLTLEQRNLALRAHMAQGVAEDLAREGAQADAEHIVRAVNEARAVNEVGELQNVTAVPGPPRGTRTVADRAEALDAFRQHWTDTPTPQPAMPVPRHADPRDAPNVLRPRVAATALPWPPIMATAEQVAEARNARDTTPEPAPGDIPDPFADADDYQREEAEDDDSDVSDVPFDEILLGDTTHLTGPTTTQEEGA